MKNKNNTRRYGHLMWVTLLSVLVGGLMPVAAGTTDEAIKRVVIYKLNGIKGLETEKVAVSVYDGVVTLEGIVPTLWVAGEAVKKAEDVDGVRSVTDRLMLASSRAGDEEIAATIAKAIRRYPFYTIFDNVRVAVSDGEAVLMGEVLHPWHKTDMHRIVSRIRGVTGISNELEVLPSSMSDDRIRLRVARAIYGDANLHALSLRADPPIHIIVKNGNVRLEGVVLTEVDKAIAGRNARFAATFFDLENNLRVETASDSTK